MNYYPFHIGDYAVHTRHLSLLEDLAYRRLLDLYYTREEALPADPTAVARLAGMRDNVIEVQAVLEEFFQLAAIGWTHARCAAEIGKANEAANRARTNGSRGGRPVGTHKEPAANPDETQRVISGNPEETKSEAPNTQYPLPKTINSEPIGSGAKAPMTAVDIIFGYGVPLLVNAGSTDRASRSFLGGLRKGHGDAAVIDALRNCLREKPLQPLEWLAAALPPLGAKAKPNAQEALEASNAAVAERFLAKDAHVAH